MNYIVSGRTPMGPIPDHSIRSPFSRVNPTAIKSDDRFNKYRAYIVSEYQELYDKYMYVKGGFTCAVCGAYMNSTSCSRILGHLASIKHLKAAGVLEKCDSNDGRVGSKHIKNSSTAPVDHVVADISDGLGD